LQDLGTLPGGTCSEAFAINDKGQIVGQADDADGVTLAVMWRSGQIHILGKLGGKGKSATGTATGINNAGQVVGWSTIDASKEIHPFLWSASTGMQDLGTQGVSSYATGINNLGEVVGYSGGGGLESAFLWTSSNGGQSLGTLGGSLSIALAINDTGQVVGYSTLP
jgi:probable HAF family extracellular repeat protein